MTVQLSVTVRNARLNAIETAVGVSAKLAIRTGAQPGNCAAADSGDLIATLTLPADWMDVAASGSKAMLGAWAAAATGAGTAAHWRLYASDGTTCHAQGSVGQGSGDLSLDDTTITVGQYVTVTGFTLSDANA